jgi:hypothetical protein
MKEKEEERGHNATVRRKIKRKRQKRGIETGMPRLSTRKRNLSNFLTTPMMNNVSN